jgi:hypothetical protein
MGATAHIPPTRKSYGLAVKHFPEVSGEAVSIIANSSAVYGSHGTALLVAAEILVQQKRSIQLRYGRMKKSGAQAYAVKLLPRTVELLDRLAPIYGNRSKVIDACAMVIKTHTKSR